MLFGYEQRVLPDTHFGCASLSTKTTRQLHRPGWLLSSATVVSHAAAFRARVVGDSTCIVQHTTCCTTLECLSCTSALGDELVAGFLLSRSRYGNSDLACDLLGSLRPAVSSVDQSGCAFFYKPRCLEATCGCGYTVAYVPLSSLILIQPASLT
jgi:hypothetical protein